MADEKKEEYLMFPSDVNQVRALRKHLKNIDKPRKKRKAKILNIEGKKTPESPSAETKSVETFSKPKEMHIYLPSV